MKTAIYIDALNLYYGSLKGSEYKWLDLKQLAQNLLFPKHEIIAVNYFTTRVTPKPTNPHVHERQDKYIRALEKTIPELTIFYGHFLRNKTYMPTVKPPPKTIRVYKTEEKGSDVNLAVHLLNDAWKGVYECAVVVSNDSDMAEAMRLVKENHPDKMLGLFNPYGKKRATTKLREHADFVRQIQEKHLKNAQLPSPIPNTKISKPKGWEKG
ncbi:MAG: NYN domain-containing protein [Parvibaculales bacterium]